MIGKVPVCFLINGITGLVAFAASTYIVVHVIVVAFINYS